MSRALDASTISSLSASNGQAQKIYTDIVNALHPPSSQDPESNTLLEIEFLGKSHVLPPNTNVLIDGNNIAIPKIKLVQAFIVARKILFQYLATAAAGSKDPVKRLEKDIEAVEHATAVILLMDPEHLTAANTRKRSIQRYIQHEPFYLDTDIVLKNELRFVDSYLTSRLHRHTKSPTLWGYRRWIVEQSDPSDSRRDVVNDLKTVVLIAAERHPKNYYAWTHMRWLLKRKYTCLNPSMSNLESKDKDELRAIIVAVKDWCLRHPGDTSGFSFLLFMLSNFQVENSLTETPSGPEIGPLNPENELCSVVCQEVLRLADSFKWTHEAVWVFLRTLVAGYGTETDRVTFFNAIDNISISVESHTVLDKARDWCRRHQRIGWERSWTNTK